MSTSEACSFSGKYACRAMKTQGYGNIVVTVSAAATNAYRASPSMARAKRRVRAHPGMARDWGKYGDQDQRPGSPMECPSTSAPPLGPGRRALLRGVTASTIRPGWNPKRSFPGPLKVQRPPGLRDNAAVATFLASDDSQYMSGLTIPSCDGGSIAISSMHFPEDWSLEEQVGGA